MPNNNNNKEKKRKEKEQDELSAIYKLSPYLFANGDLTKTALYSSVAQNSGVGYTERAIRVTIGVLGVSVDG